MFLELPNLRLEPSGDIVLDSEFVRYGIKASQHLLIRMGNAVAEKSDNGVDVGPTGGCAIRARKGEMRDVYWDSMRVEGFDDLVRAIPDKVLASPRRSVVPLVDWFRDPVGPLQVLGSEVGFNLGASTILAFEHAVPVQRGSGKASFTDLMIRGEDLAVAIEAKYTEPRYESVQAWLGPSPTANRVAVLGGWLSLINVVGKEVISVDSVLDLPYQLVHRAASACETDVAHRALVYLCFGDGSTSHYLDDLARLDGIMGKPEGMGVHVLGMPFEAGQSFRTLAERWDAGERHLSDEVREALLGGPLSKFGAIRRVYSRPSQSSLRERT